jgi:hypothetical protein
MQLVENGTYTTRVVERTFPQHEHVFFSSNSASFCFVTSTAFFDSCKAAEDASFAALNALENMIKRKKND